MKFRVRVELWFDADGFHEAEAAAHAIENAAYDSIASAVISDPVSGGFSRTELEPMDKAAIAALAAEDLGPGIVFVRSHIQTDTETS